MRAKEHSVGLLFLAFDLNKPHAGLTHRRCNRRSVVGVILGGKLLGIGMIAATGIVGFALRNVVFKWIEHIYKNEKHLTLEAYKQKNA